MTLDTNVYVLDPISHRDVFLKCNQLIGAHEGIRATDKQAESGERLLYNHPGQGVCALLDVHYRPDAPLKAGTSHWDDCEPDCDYQPHLQPCWLKVSFDTAYGYRGDNGEGCGDLHARLVFELGQWLDERGVRWKWQNEFTGEIHQGYDRLGDLCSGGADASAWFNSAVLPAIRKGVAS